MQFNKLDIWPFRLQFKLIYPIIWQGKVPNNGTYCVYDSDIATGLGVGALLFLLASQLLIMVASRCLCCGRALSPSRSRACAIFLFITCWYVFLLS